MRTITEIPALVLKNAAKTHAELTAAGKTAEELPAAMGEALKLEGEKLNYMMAAIEVVGTKQNDLKRVIVMAPNEGEKAPSKGVQKGDYWYVTEYFAPLHKAGSAPHERGGKGGRDGDRKGKGRGGKGRGGRPGERGGERGPGRGPGGPGRGGDRPAEAGAAFGGREGAGGGGRGERRPPKAPFTGPKGVIVPKSAQPKPTAAPEPKPEAPSEDKSSS